MGSYVYKVTSKTKKLSNGETANIGVYAYKPYGWDRKANHKMAFETGTLRCEAEAEKGNRSCWVTHGDPDEYPPGEPVTVLKFNAPTGSYVDDAAVPKYAVKGVTVLR